MDEKVLVATGGFLHSGETSLARALRKQATQWRSSEEAWLDLKVKLVAAEPLLAARAARKRRSRPEVEAFFARAETVETPELTEALLATLLHAEGMPYEVASFDELSRDPAPLERTTCVLLSSTMLRDLSELEPLVRALRRPHHRVVVGGALAAALAPSWEGLEGVDVLAVGYGEALVPALVRWVRSGYADLAPPPGGSVERRGDGWVLRSGVPEGLSLDHLPVADWALSARDRGRRYRLVHYESVRGCPYRCGFCNYPYLFDDTRFRTRSAERIAADWVRYAEETGAEFVNCLDSLFTMPRRRLTELCERLLDAGTPVKWICYARADDLADEATVRLMRRAGAHLVHVGVESGDQGQLDRMNKRVTVEANAAAMRHCRREGLTTLASLVVGYPGETRASLDATMDFLRETPPDFHYLAVFNTRLEAVPVLRPESRAAFGLTTARGGRTGAPYWRHATMDCREACDHARRMERDLALDRVSLNAAVFYAGILGFDPAQRDALLGFQRDAWLAGRARTLALDLAHRCVDRRLREGVARLPAAPAPEGVPA